MKRDRTNPDPNPDPWDPSRFKRWNTWPRDRRETMWWFDFMSMWLIITHDYAFRVKHELSL